MLICCGAALVTLLAVGDAPMPLWLDPPLVAHITGLIAGYGVAVMLVEQNVVQSLELASRAYVLADGQCIMSGAAAELGAYPELKRAYLGL
jgi:branched-chain amino acid transport system ATP-binding protein